MFASSVSEFFFFGGIVPSVGKIRTEQRYGFFLRVFLCGVSNWNPDRFPLDLLPCVIDKERSANSSLADLDYFLDCEIGECWCETIVY